MKTTHTPGPWDAPSAGVYAADGLLVCTLGSANCVRAYNKRSKEFDAGPVECQITANAALIAAAPELLAALEAMLAIESEITDLKAYNKTIQNARSAIAKARGLP